MPRNVPGAADNILRTLEHFGLHWDEAVLYQSQRNAAYGEALDKLKRNGMVYPCVCSRKEIADSTLRGIEGLIYPGTCRNRDANERSKRIAAGEAYALRLDVTQAARLVAKDLVWKDRSHGSFTAQPNVFGDVVLARKDTPASYHLAVVVDDALQGITLVTHGEDLLEATHLHRLLQELLGLPVPEWQHHRLITDETGKRLAKRDDARSLRSLRTAGWTPERVTEQVD